MEQPIAEKRRRLVGEWVAQQLERSRRTDALPLEEFLVAGGIPHAYLASLNGELKDEELLERFVQYVLARIFPNGELNIHAITEWDLVYDLGPYPRKEAPTVDEVRSVLERKVRERLALIRTP